MEIIQKSSNMFLATIMEWRGAVAPAPSITSTNITPEPLRASDEIIESGSKMEDILNEAIKARDAGELKPLNLDEPF